MKWIIKKLFWYKIIRYSIWWWTAALIDLWFLWLFTDIIWIHYLLSAVWAFVISFSFGYRFQKYITFRNNSKKHLLQWWLFLLFQLIWQWLYMWLLWLWVDQFWIYYMFVAIIAKWIVFIRNYISNYYFNFKK